MPDMMMLWSQILILQKIKIKGKRTLSQFNKTKSLLKIESEFQIKQIFNALEILHIQSFLIKPPKMYVLF